MQIQRALILIAALGISVVCASTSHAEASAVRSCEGLWRLAAKGVVTEVRPIGPEYTTAVHRIWSAPGVRERIGPAGFYSKSEVTESLMVELPTWLELLVSKSFFDSNLTWGIFSSGELVGTVTLEAWNGAEKNEAPQVFYVLGYSLAPAAWGKGLATSAVSQVLDLAFSEGRGDVVVANTFPDNDASIAVLKRLGFTDVSDSDPSVKKFALVKAKRSRH